MTQDEDSGLGRLQPLLSELLAAALDGEPVRFLLEVRGVRASLSIGAPREEPRPARNREGKPAPVGHESPSGRGQFYSPLEGAIVAYLATRGREWATTREIAQALDAPESGQFRSILRNLVERSLVEPAKSRGFRLYEDTPVPEGQSDSVTSHP